jgi:beta-glucosidase
MNGLFLLLIIPALAIVYFGLLFSLTDRMVNLRIDFKKLKKEPWRFGRDFLWGSATSAHQVEGDCDNNNWFRFESAVDEDGNPRIYKGQKAGKACDHWNRYKEDIRLMKELSLNSYRFSVEWSKIEPKRGEFGEAALDHYEKVVDELLANGIEPMVTLHHFTDPLWFEEQGAFLKDDSPEVFTRFVEHVVRRLGKKVKLWCTINEPSAYSFTGYYVGQFPPAEKDLQKAAAVQKNLLRAHTAAYMRIKEIQPDAQVGLVINIIIYEPPNRWNLLDVIFSRLMSRNMNDSHFVYLVDGRYKYSMPGMVNISYDSGIRDTFDFIGLNYYMRFHFKLSPFGRRKLDIVQKAPLEKLTDMDWEIYPEGLYRALKLVARYTSKPIYITENGIADNSDTKRAEFIEDHLLAVNKALGEGVDIKGYYYWSLLDNFEWAWGFERRFGLYHVDFTTQKRKLREGSRRYPEIILASRGEEE